jgi:hypothetical protein
VTRGFSTFLLIHAIITFAAGIILVVSPATIPGAVGIQLDAQQYLLAYLLAGAEFGFAALSFAARGLRDRKALDITIVACVIFHASTAALEGLAFLQGTDAKILGNVVFRLCVVAGFLYFYRRT